MWIARQPVDTPTVRPEHGPRRRLPWHGGRRQGPLRWLLTWLSLAVLPAVTGSAQETNQPVPETAVVSAYLVNFLHFVEWPDEAFSSPQAPYQVCIRGQGDLFKTLAVMAEGQERKGRGLLPRTLTTLDDVEGCHVLYIESASRQEAKSTFEQLPSTTLLTVGRSRDFLDMGGGINLVVVEQRLRFEVNRDAIEESGLKVDSRLLDAASDVRQSRRKRRRQP